MKKQLILVSASMACLIILCLFACQPDKENNAAFDYTELVNPLIGTHNMGHTYPGATVPFGMVQLSPATGFQSFHRDNKYNPDTYRYCSGYQYGDSLIFGFAHTHFSGTGHSDLGDFLLMPATGSVSLDPGYKPLSSGGWGSRFKHENETAQPAYYRVTLDDCPVTAELTASERVGMHRYTFCGTDTANLILDMMYNIYHHDSKNVWVFLRVENDTLVTGYRQTHGWARTRYMYFAMTFSKPISEYGCRKFDNPGYNGFYRKFDEQNNFPEMAGRNLRAWFRFDLQNAGQLQVKMALSAVSTDGALKNLKAEIPHWDFDKVRDQGRKKWNWELSKIEAAFNNRNDSIVFYSALYHTMLAPVVYEDADGSYRGLDQNIHTSEGFTNYTIFSLWDTYRAQHPLLNLLHPARNNDMIHSMLAHYDQSVHHMLPIWSHHANENWCMIGYHAVSVIADAIVKGTTTIDKHKALRACVSTANVPYYDGIKYYASLGYVPEDKSSNSVSKTLEYAYNDWCIAQIALATGDQTVYLEYLERAKNYQNLFDPESGYMRPKLSDGKWRSEFDPLDTHGQGFIEGNALNYGLYTPHSVEQMIEMMGGKDLFATHLDRIFEITLDDRYIEKNEDITRDGIIGAYVHGNEPGHHIPYLYNWTNKPWKTQERVRMIMRTMYANAPNGLCGNDDAGQMSAWYIFSALGFYPVCPGSTHYAIGSPLVNGAVIRLGNGKHLTIQTRNQGEKNVYLDRVLVNGKEIKCNHLTQDELAEGGEITFIMSSTPRL